MCLTSRLVVTHHSLVVHSLPEGDAAAACTLSSSDAGGADDAGRMGADTLMFCLPLHRLLAGTVSAAFTLTDQLPKMMFGCTSDGPQRLSAV